MLKLSFWNANYSYNGNFNWQRGSDILNNVSDQFGNKLGRVNTIQNSNNQTLNLAVNLDKLYRQINFQKNNVSGLRIKIIGEKILKKTIKELDKLIINEFKKT